MAHELFGERFVGMRTPAWHNLGTVLQEQVTVEEALKIGGLDFKYVDAPVGYTLPDGTFVEGGTKKMILREPTADSPEWVELGMAGRDYQYLQNEELARGLDAIAQQTGWKFETVGALKNGSVVFMTLDAGSRDVRGDEYRNYVLVSDGKVAGKALTISVTPVRVVCQNTLSMAESGTDVKVRIVHGRRVQQEYSFWLGYVAAVQRAQERTFAALDQMTRVKINDDQAKAIIAAAYPLPEASGRSKTLAEAVQMEGFDDETIKAVAERSTKTDQWYLDRANKLREGAFTLYQRVNTGEEQGVVSRGKLAKKTLEAIRETPYAALQGVTELVDWGGQDAHSTDRMAIFGEGGKIKKRAFEAALAASR